MIKRSFYTPAHLFVDDMPYFITGAIHQKRSLLTAPELKQHLITLIKKNFQTAGWQLNDFVILDNHYHLLATSTKGKDLPNIIKGIHGASASLIRQKTNCKLPVWWNYWDYCPRDEKEYYTKLNYLYMNPIKHGYVTSLNDYPFSSFSSRLTRLGREAMVKQFHSYPNNQNPNDIYDDF